MAELNQVGPEPAAIDAPATPRKRKKKNPFPEPDYGEGYKYEPEFKGPVKKRSCTDVLCLALFVVFLGAWGFVAYFAVSEGDINKVSPSSNSFIAAFNIVGTSAFGCFASFSQKDA